MTKRITALVTALSSLGMMFVGGSAAGSLPEGMAGMGGIVSMAGDPWLNGFAVLVSLLYLWWARGQDGG